MLKCEKVDYSVYGFLSSEQISVYRVQLIPYLPVLKLSPSTVSMDDRVEHCTVNISSVFSIANA